jgi:hypothetical protein
LDLKGGVTFSILPGMDLESSSSIFIFIHHLFISPFGIHKLEREAKERGEKLTKEKEQHTFSQSATDQVRTPIYVP